MHCDIGINDKTLWVNYKIEVPIDVRYSISGDMTSSRENGLIV